LRIVVDQEKCRASGECVKICPQGALTIVDGTAVVDHEKCDLDGICIPACPWGAIGFSEED
jgi:NAD-dependent dihydropyrimidine dehydrogenase PreA subunit